MTQHNTDTQRQELGDISGDSLQVIPKLSIPRIFQTAKCPRVGTGMIGNTYSFQATWSLVQLLNSAIEEQK